MGKRNATGSDSDLQKMYENLYWEYYGFTPRPQQHWTRTELERWVKYLQEGLAEDV